MIGTVLRGRYELTGTLSDGPLFTTFSARDRIGGRDVSVRILKPPFSREGPFVAKLRVAISKSAAVGGPQIERVYEVEDFEGTTFLVGDLSRGPTLADRIRKLAPFSIPLSTAIAVSLCTALDLLHRRGHVHGDVQTGNALVMTDTDVRLQLAGIWEAYSGSATAGSVVLSAMAPYMAPEVAQGGVPTPQSDVYSLGVILHELTTGRQPFYADSTFALVAAHRDRPIPKIRELNPSVPNVLEEIFAKSMAKDPADRYRTAGEMAADLRLLQDALRFGKQLHWPLRGGGGTPNRGLPAAPRVTPTMTAIRSPQEAEEQVERQRNERDVPIWMLFIMAMLGAAVLCLGGLWLYFNLNKPRLVTVPNVMGLTVSEARSVLGENKLQFRLAGRVSNEQVEADRVLEVNPEPGQQMRESGTVAVTLSSGSRFVIVPDVKGMTVDRATSVLGALRLELETPVPAVPSDAAIGTVVQQVPPPRARVERETRVRLTVSGGPRVYVQDAPADDVTFLYTVKIRVSEVPAPVQVRVDVIDSEYADGRTVYIARRNALDEFTFETRSRDPKVTLNIYYDEELVSSVEKSAEGALRE